jgi:ABC-type sugar transport system ATPase subunit
MRSRGAEDRDRNSVLRSGKLVHTGPATGLDRPAIMRMMVARDIAATHYAAVDAEGELVAEPPAAGPKKSARYCRSVENVTIGSFVKKMSFLVHQATSVRARKFMRPVARWRPNAERSS